VKVAAVVIAGYAVALPVVVWCLRDLRSFHRPLWTGYGNRRSWVVALLVAYALAGWPALFVALGWRTGQLRRELDGARERFRDERSDHSGPGPSRSGAGYA
jgi:hypothetical protein